MPVMRVKLTSRQVNEARGLTLCQILTPDQYGKTPDVWIDRSGKVIYAGFWQHDESASCLGFIDAKAAEKAGYIHFTSTKYDINGGTPQCLYCPKKLPDKQYDTLCDYCLANNIANPALQ